MLYPREDDGKCVHDELGGRPIERTGFDGFQCPLCGYEVVYALDESGKRTGKAMLYTVRSI